MTSINLTRKVATPSDIRVALRGVSSPVVYCKVDDSSGPIAPGDRLVPSTATFGHAMRAAGASNDSTVIGEAIAAFDGGCGLIPVAVSTKEIALLHRRLDKQNRRGRLLYKILKH